MKDRTITPERIERALDGLAGVIVAHGREGEELLPLYERLEAMLVASQLRETRIASVRSRASTVASRL